MLNSTSENIAHIDEMSGQTSAGARQPSVISENLARRANELKQTASQFIILRKRIKAKV